MKWQMARPDTDTLEAARLAMRTEAEAISMAAHQLDCEMALAMEAILAHRGQVIVTGSIRSEQLARKLALTLCTTGTPATFMDSTRALSGDLDGYTPGDPVLMISEKEAPGDLTKLAAFLRDGGSSVIGILTSGACPLASEADFVLAARLKLEPDPLRLGALVPAAVLTAMGDALAFALMRARTVASTTPDS